MKDLSRRLQICRSAALALSFFLIGVAGAYARDPLPSWNDGPAKEAILSFVKETTEKSSPKYVEPKDRVATFDQDGTLWTEHPLYTEAMFTLDRVRALAPQHPEWHSHEPFRTVLLGDADAPAKFTERDWMAICDAAEAGMSTDAFRDIV